MKNKNWVKRKLGNISLSISSGITPSRKNEAYWTNGKIPWLKTGQLGNPRIYNTVEKVTELALKGTSLKLLPINTISLAMYGEGQTRGRVSILKSEMSTNQACCNIILNQDLADYEFIYYCLKNKYLSLRSISSGVRKNLNSELIKELEIQMPENLNEQRALVSLLSLLDTKIELNNKINAELEAMAKLIYDYWFVQFDFPDENGKPYKSSGGKMVYNKELKREIPAGWEVKELGDMAQTASGGTPLSTNKEYYDNGNIPWINSGELNNKYIVFTKNYITDIGLENSNTKLFPPKTILMAMYGATAGKVSLLEIEASTNQAICAIMPNSKVFRNYLKFALENLYNYLINISTGSARDNLSQDKIRKLTFVLPVNHIIKDFNNIINPTIDKILINQTETQHLTNLRDWLLPMLMNGQVTVRGLLPHK